MASKDEFYIGYSNQMGKKTKKTLIRFLVVVSISIFIGVLIFAYFQKPFANSTFELQTVTELQGVYHEKPYPMLRVQLGKKTYKNILLLGFGKSSANRFIARLMEKEGDLNGKMLSLEGNLIYYNGKTLIQITDKEKVTLANSTETILSDKEIIGKIEITGEVIDPKCYFGVMKPGLGKIHRSCAVRCISGGIPPVFVSTDNAGISNYFLLTDMEGNKLGKEILPFVGKITRLSGVLEKSEDWNILKVNTKDMVVLSHQSIIYPESN